MRYSVFAGGKRFRPALCLAAYGALRGPGSVGPAGALRVAAALEMIHTYSLIHDDLPCMDDDALRRGRPSNHMVFGEAAALLAGSALLVRAFELLAAAAGPGRADASARIVAVVADAIGSGGMIGGQIADIAAEGKPPTLKRVLGIHTRKTGALITASVTAGGILAGGDRRALERLRRYGDGVGLAFQIVDDCLDQLATEAEMGKRVGRDRERGKVTYPGAVGLRKSESEARRLVGTSRRAVEVLPRSGGALPGLADLVIDRLPTAHRPEDSR
jgi:geranylgeranyl diphosphate synthase type II